MVMLIGRFILSLCLAALLIAPADARAQQAPDPELLEALRAAANTADSFDDRFAAEVWLADMSRRLQRQVKDPDERFLKSLKTRPVEWICRGDHEAVPRGQRPRHDGAGGHPRPRDDPAHGGRAAARGPERSLQTGSRLFGERPRTGC